MNQNRLDRELDLFVFLKMSDFPVNQETQRAAQHDDRADGCDFLQITRNHGAQDFAAKLEFQSQCQ